MGLTLLIDAMQFLRGDAKAVRIMAHLVEREQPVVDVEGGIFEAFGHDRRGHLLELAHKALLLCPVLLAGRRRVREQEHIPHKRKQLAADDGVFPLCPGHGLLDKATVVRMQLVASNIGAIDREARDHFL